MVDQPKFIICLKNSQKKISNNINLCLNAEKINSQIN